MNKIIRKFRLLSIPALLVAVILGASIYVNNVHASDPGSILNKWRWAHYYECLQHGGWMGSFDASEVSESKKVVKYLYEDTNGDVFLPSYRYGHDLADESISCYKSIVGKDSWIGSLQDQSSIKFSQPSEMETLLRNLDYLPDSETGQSKQFTIHATTATNEIDYALITPQTEWTPGEEDSVVIYTEPNDSGGTRYWYDDGWDNFFNAISISFGDGNITVAMEYGWLSSCTAPADQSVTVQLQVDPMDTRAALESALGNLTWYTTCYHDSAQIQRKKTTRYDFVVGEVVNMGESGTYRHQHIDDRYTGASLASQNYGGGTLIDLVPTREEQYNLYLYYLQHFIPQNVQNRLTSNPTSTVNLTKIKLKSTDGTFKDFYANLNGVSPSSTTVYSLNNYYLNEDNSKHFPKVVAMTMQQVIDWFNSVDTSTLGEVDLTEDDDGAITTTTTTTTGGGEDDGSQTNKLEEACYQNAKSLGWVICPMIFGLREVTESIYSFIEPLIQVNETTVSQLGDQNSNLFRAWNTFRGFANIIFVILFMFIIFSQLTGYGIDNYGIKKMLPKLIITAILVNLSFVIAALAVDASNIVGKGIEGLFENLGGTIMMKDVSGAETGTISGTVAITDSVGVQSHLASEVVSWLVIAIGGLGVGFLLQGWAIIIPILLFLLTTIISIIFAMIILGLRQAIVIILIVLSPVAFACTVLPNTEKIFNKWLGAFKGVLMVYPIVGALIGAGYFTSSLIYTGEESGTGFIMTLVAGLLAVIPYFLIPSLTRKSLEAIGNVGEKLHNFGKSKGDGLRRGINDTDAVRNAKADSRALNKSLGAKLYMKTFGKKTGKDLAEGKNVSTRRANRYTRAAELANTNKQSRISARSAMSQYNRLNSESGFQAAMSSANMAEDATAVKNFETMISAGDFKLGDGSKLDSQNNEAIAAALQHELTQTGNNYDANKVRALTNALAAKGKEGRNLMYSAVNGAQQAGASRQAIKDFSSNIMNNHAGTMKEKHRSLYEFAKATAGLDASAAGDAESISSFAASGVGSLTAADMTNMDIQQLRRYRENVSGDDTQTLAQLAQSALSDEHLSKDLSEKTRSELEKIAQQGGFSSMSGDSGKIHTAAAQDSQQLTATQAAALIQDAVKNNRASASTDPLVQKAEADALNAIKSGAADAAPKSVIIGPDGKPLSRK